jgi:FkbM family methyltransferase
LKNLNFLRVHIPEGGVFVDVGANVGTYALAIARHVGAGGKVIAIEPHPITCERFAFNRDASGLPQVKLVAAAAGACEGELTIATNGANLAASQIVSGEPSKDTIRVPSQRLLRILSDAGAEQINALKIDVEGFEDRVLTGFFREAPQRLWPRGGGDRALVPPAMAE